jgi:hypothetical protein
MLSRSVPHLVPDVVVETTATPIIERSTAGVSGPERRLATTSGSTSGGSSDLVVRQRPIASLYHKSYQVVRVSANHRQRPSGAPSQLGYVFQRQYVLFALDSEQGDVVSVETDDLTTSPSREARPVTPS